MKTCRFACGDLPVMRKPARLSDVGHHQPRNADQSNHSSSEGPTSSGPYAPRPQDRLSTQNAGPGSPVFVRWNLRLRNSVTCGNARAEVTSSTNTNVASGSTDRPMSQAQAARSTWGPVRVAQITGWPPQGTRAPRLPGAPRLLPEAGSGRRTGFDEAPFAGEPGSDVGSRRRLLLRTPLRG